MKEQFKPMLAVNADKEKIQYPCLCSTKLDGIRCIFKDGKMLARSLKPITSETLQKRFQWLKDFSKKNNIILDGELYSHEMTFTEISHYVRKEEIEVPESIRFKCFDMISNGLYDEPFIKRYTDLLNIDFRGNLDVVKQKTIELEDELDEEFENALKSGYEGLILRSIYSPYKCGRSSINEGYLLKLKPFESFDANILGVEERMDNLNESQKNELGRSFKRDTKGDKKPTGIAAVFNVEYEGKPLKVTITGDEEFRREIWENKEKYIGKMIEYKGMVVGMKDVPRHCNFLRFRTDRD
jgi:DNA ligase-1